MALSMITLPFKACNNLVKSLLQLRHQVGHSWVKQSRWSWEKRNTHLCPKKEYIYFQSHVTSGSQIQPGGDSWSTILEQVPMKSKTIPKDTMLVKLNFDIPFDVIFKDRQTWWQLQYSPGEKCGRVIYECV